MSSDSRQIPSAEADAEKDPERAFPALPLLRRTALQPATPSTDTISAGTQSALQRSERNFRNSLDAARSRIEQAGQPSEKLLEEEPEFFESIRSRLRQGGGEFFNQQLSEPQSSPSQLLASRVPRPASRVPRPRATICRSHR